ncbi:MAG: ribosome biogenesis GTPase Der [Phycisphaera sp.]|nr:MAG: ribosome biogenesis GTPase Der [Phycisphaera sp.]
MPIPRIAIVGRPNVGKSSLMNMLAHSKVSIVDDLPGVTRDRVTTIIDLPHSDGRPERPVEITDTGGYGVYVAEGQRYDEVGADLSTLTDDVEGQIEAAVSDADLILFCVDVQAGLTPRDEEIARLLREQKLGRRDRAEMAKLDPSLGKQAPVYIVATKVDGPKWETHAYEMSALGFGEPLMCSARNNYMRRDISDRLYDLLPAEDETASVPPADLSIAVIGKRNAGKSTLVNALAGAERVIVSEIAGTTRDAIDVLVEKDGKRIIVIDTAGMRRKKSFQGKVEWFAFDRVQRAIDRADVVMLMIDSTEPTSQVDQQLAMLCQNAFKPTILAVNKWDLAEGRTDDKGRPVTPERYEKYVREGFKGLPFAPIALLSAKAGLNIDGVLELAFDLKKQAHERVSTGALNRLIRSILEKRGPATKIGTMARMFYVAQVGTAPPTIAMVVNEPKLFTPNYMRYLMNRLREQAPFDEIPFRVFVRSRKQFDKRREQAERRDKKGLIDTSAFDRGEDLELTPDEIESLFRIPGEGSGEGGSFVDESGIEGEVFEDAEVFVFGDDEAEDTRS